MTMLRPVSVVVRRSLRLQTARTLPCDVFINHRGVDTKRNLAGLLYHRLIRAGLRPFLDAESMVPGDRLRDRIDAALGECKVGIALISPTYCQSYFCLHELRLMMEARTKVVPIFCDVKPSELRVGDGGTWPPEEVEQFWSALEEVKHTVGLAFDTRKGDWAEFLTHTTNVVIDTLQEAEVKKIKEPCK